MTNIYRYRGESCTLSDLEAISSLSKEQIYSRINNGWDIDSAINEPKRGHKKEKVLEFSGHTKTVRDWSVELGIPKGMIFSRLRAGWSVGEVLTSPKHVSCKPRPIRKPHPRPPIPSGWHWESQYKVVGPNGEVYDYTNRAKKIYPKIQLNICPMCEHSWYRCMANRSGHVMCRKCNGTNGSHARASMWAELRELGYESERAKNYKNRADKFGVSYDGSVTLAGVMGRDSHKCQECFIDLQRHGGGFHPEGWSIGHIVPMSMGGGHEWDNVQAECMACNMWKGNRLASVDWGEVVGRGGNIPKLA